MDLYTEMQGAGKPTQRFRLEVILEELPADEAESLLVALSDPAVLSTRISEVLAKHGYPISDNAVRNYRQKKCVKS